jgi:hypothetical protein
MRGGSAREAAGDDGGGWQALPLTDFALLVPLDPAGAAAAGRGGLDDPLQHGLLAELDQVQPHKLAERRGDLGRAAGHGWLLGHRTLTAACRRSAEPGVSRTCRLSRGATPSQ